MHDYERHIIESFLRTLAVDILTDGEGASTSAELTRASTLLVEVADGLEGPEAQRVTDAVAGARADHLRPVELADALVTTGFLAEISRERKHQRSVWGRLHDIEEHAADAELLVRAAELLLADTPCCVEGPKSSHIHDAWGLVDKHGGTHRGLIIAQALVLAELEKRKAIAEPPKERWVWGYFEESFGGEEFDSREDAAAAGLEEIRDNPEFDRVYTGCVRRISLGTGSLADQVEESVHEQLFDEIGDAADDWKMDAADNAKLEALLSYFLDEMHMSKFAVHDIEEHASDADEIDTDEVVVSIAGHRLTPVTGEKLVARDQRLAEAEDEEPPKCH